MESALLLGSPAIAVILQHPQEGRFCVLVVTVGEESGPAFKRPVGKLPWTCTGNFSSEKPEVSHLLPTWGGLRLMSLGSVHACKFPCAKCLRVPVSQESGSLHCTNRAKHLPRIISQLGNGKLLG